MPEALGPRNAEAALADSPAEAICLPLLPVPEARRLRGSHCLAGPGSHHHFDVLIPGDGAFLSPHCPHHPSAHSLAEPSLLSLRNLSLVSTPFHPPPWTAGIQNSLAGGGGVSQARGDGGTLNFPSSIHGGPSRRHPPLLSILGCHSARIHPLRLFGIHPMSRHHILILQTQAPQLKKAQRPKKIK